MAYVSTRLKSTLVVSHIIMIHYFEYTEDFIFKGESHDFWEFVYVDKGEIEVLTDRHQYHLKKGDLVFHKPNEFHALRSLNKTTPNLAVISFKSRSDCLRFFYDQLFHLSHQEENILSTIITEARNAFSNPMNIPSIEQLTRSKEAPFASEQLLKIAIEQLLINMIRHRTNCYLQQTIPLEKPSVSPKLKEIITYMEQHVTDSLTIQQLCSLHLISRSTLHQLFHQELDCGAIHYFHRLKIDVAKQLLRQKKMNCTELSSFLSYSSLHHFSKKFKQYTGMSPSEYTALVHTVVEQLTS